MENAEGFNGFHLQGELQLDAAERALSRHKNKVGSSALNIIAGLREVEANLPDYMKKQRSNASVYVNDPDLKQDLVHSLEQELQRTDLDDDERISFEELLSIQQNGQRGVN